MCGIHDISIYMQTQYMMTPPDVSAGIYQTQALRLAHLCSRHAYIHTYIHAYMHTCIHAYMHTCIHAYMHTCMPDVYDDMTPEYIHIRCI
jgi:hypothetical protein